MMVLLCSYRREVLRESYVVSVAMEENNRRKDQLTTHLMTLVFHLASFMCHSVSCCVQFSKIKPQTFITKTLSCHN